MAIPYKVLEVKETSLAEIEIAGVRHKVSSALVPDVKADDWVLVNLGTIITRIDESEAKEILNIFKEMAEAVTL
ncbi:MAG TPA: HypC/HybG/HupF family hydrogenase formation chaperone [Dehalococcoidales bacterium]|nr:HypC/HybG/HupF family hydrogenase formation chaperone [Dehalococcoidales bacterium]